MLLETIQGFYSYLITVYFANKKVNTHLQVVKQLAMRIII